MQATNQKRPTLIQAFIPIIFLIVLLVFNYLYWKDETLYGSNQVALLLAAAVASIVSVGLGVSWKKVKKNIVKTISSSMPSILILLLIGSLAGTWMISGVVPALIYYGLEILHPRIFLFAAVIISSLVSLATGSSWSTVATIGVALLGIGDALGISKAVVAGAIISGAYFGDKMSPLSDTTNLAPAMAGTDLFTHIRYMINTTGPSIAITLIIFLIMGFTYNFEGGADVTIVQTAIQESFNINPLLFLVPVILIVVIILKVPPLPSLMVGILAGGLAAVIFQPHIIEAVSGVENNYAKASYISVMQSMFGDVSVETANKAVSDLFSTSGMYGMLKTIWLILAAMTFGGVMESSGLLLRITQSIIRFAKSTGSLVASTVGTCIFFNLTASDQYISIVVPGRMYANTYRDKGYKPELLSRTLEDSGTITSVLIPWNTCGATQSAVLGVPVLTYAPYAFFNIISPFMTMFFAYAGIRIRRYTKEEMEEIKAKSKIKVEDNDE